MFAGSYDHTVKLFDARTKSSVMTIEHGHPVESVLLFPSGGLLVSAGNSIMSDKYLFCGSPLRIFQLLIFRVVFQFDNEVVRDVIVGFLKYFL